MCVGVHVFSSMSIRPVEATEKGRPHSVSEAPSAAPHTGCVFLLRVPHFLEASVCNIFNHASLSPSTH